MIEYAKNILPKVSGWKDLFKKELNKCVQWEDEDKLDILFCWCYENFSETHGDVLFEVFGVFRKPVDFPELKTVKKHIYENKMLT